MQIFAEYVVILVEEMGEFRDQMMGREGRTGTNGARKNKEAKRTKYPGICVLFAPVAIANNKIGHFIGTSSIANFENKSIERA